MRKYFFPLVIAISSLFLESRASRIKFIEVDALDQWEKFLFLADQSKLGILVEICDYSSVGCSQMHSGAFRDRSLSNFINENFIAISIPAESEFGKQFGVAFPVMAYPTYFFGSPDEVFFEKIEGVVSAELFATVAKKSIKQAIDYPKLIDAYFNDQLTKSQWLSLLDITELNKGQIEAQALAREFMLVLDEKDLSDTTFWPFISRFCVDENNAIYKTILSNPELLKNPSQKFDMESYMTNVFNFNLSMAIFERDSFKMERQILDVLPKMDLDSMAIEDLELRTRQTFFAETFSWENYVTTTKSYVASKDSMKAQYFQAFAQQLLESYEEPEAIRAAEKLIDEAIALEKNFEILMLKAYLQANDNKVEAAQKTAFEARKMAVNPQQEKIAADFINSIFDWQRR